MTRTIRTAGLAALTFLLAASALLARELSIDERVTAQEAVEQVYWNHRIWPKENPGGKPALATVMPDQAIRAKVEDYLRKSNALERFWQRPVTAEQLQAELDRMATNTRDGATLQELFGALGNDPFVIAETLGRQTLVERLIRSWYANDVRFHGGVKAKAEAALAACSSVDCMKTMGAEYRETTWTLQAEHAVAESGPGHDGVMRLDAEAWESHRSSLASTLGGSPESLPVRRISRLEETPEAFVVTAVVTQRESEIKTTTVSWPKRSFEVWWDDNRVAIGSELSELSGTFALPEAPLTACTSDTWRPTQFERPVPRSGHTAVWTGSEMIVWGGASAPNSFLDSGGRYNPSTDVWTPTSTTNAPDARERHTAVWTGTEMIVWGGADAPGLWDLGTGGRYSPLTDGWTPTSSVNAPLGRGGHTAVWTGTQMIVWGGGGNSGSPGTSTGASYIPSSDSWSPTSPIDAPTPRYSHTSVWTGTEMIVVGGISSSTPLNTGGRYNPVTGVWTLFTGSLAPRYRHTAVWTGTEMIVWGGTGVSNSALNDGARYAPSNGIWMGLPPVSAPSPRYGHAAVWTGTEMIVWGGSSEGVVGLGDGSRYAPSSNAWTPMLGIAPTARLGHTAVWTVTEMLVWGGIDRGTPVNTGGRYVPSSDTWTAALGNAPTLRAGHSAVWTGTEMIVWGGYGTSPLSTGGRFTPATNSWTPTSTGGNVPAARSDHTAAWTGSEMIVWGGFGPASLNTGGRYAPSSNTWSTTSTGANVPAARRGHTVVWTGTEMIVWGGFGASSLNTGGRYTPSINAWSTTSTGANVPAPRSDHTAVWTGTDMVIWGGNSGSDYFETGGRYRPADGTWTPTSSASAPTGRTRHTAVRTGTEMIVWGGSDALGRANTGGHYDLLTGVWAPTSTTNAPAPRTNHTAVWTGTEMIVWGGFTGVTVNTGGRYNPSTEAWAATSTGPDAPAARYDHTAVWTGAEMIVWGGAPAQVAGGAYCACPTGATYFRDADGDGFGSSGDAVVVCDGTLPSGYVTNATDCNDASAAAHPGAIEINDGLDNQCFGDSGYGETDELYGLVATSRTGFAWGAQGGATSYEVVRSPFGDFHAECTHGTTAAASWSDAAIPAPGARFFYLVRAETPYTGGWGKRRPAADRTVCAGCANTGDWCDDLSLCTAGESCIGAVCGTPVSCDDGNLCTTDSCDPLVGCVHVNNTAPCADGNFCTVNDTCGGGACVPGPARDCDEPNLCTTDSCDPELGCVHVNNTAACDDGNVCTTSDTCGGGVCGGGPAPNCDDGNVCTTDSCNPASGCVNTNNTIACDDGNACTTGDVCGGGSCAGTVPSANHLVISQIQTAGDGGTPSSDEFIEIYNPTSSPVSLSGWSIQSVVSTFPFNVSRHNLFSGTVPAHGWFLVARSSYNGPVTRDSTNLAFTLPSDGNSVFLVNSSVDVSSCTSGSIVDKVAYGNGTCGEGGAAPAPAANNSILRLPGGACGNGSDTNSNSADFVSQSPSTPRNSASPPQP